MQKLIVFNNVSVDGYFVDAAGKMDWAHAGHDDAEFQAFTSGNASGGGCLLFGRITYQMMAGYWPSPDAMKNNPGVAKAMNSMAKVVFSKTLDKASWQNTTLVTSDPAEAVRKLKAEAGPGLTILGSGTIVSLLTSQRLIDEYHLVVNPVVLGKGRTMFAGIPDLLNLKLVQSRAFKNGKVVLTYNSAA